MPTKTIQAVDLFCGAGGTSTGLSRACHSRGISLDLMALNHWNIAIETHTANHPDARHVCASLDGVDPNKAFPGGHLNIMVASPECTHHSIARGGKPINDQSRVSAWLIVRWAAALRIDNILIENVKEFEDWAPIGSNGRPMKSRKGETFQAFINALRSLNYTVEYRKLNAADYGDPTTRIRLFIQCRRGRGKITWPEPSHFKPRTEANLFAGMQPWRTAREIIDWTIQGHSIFTRKKPLAAATLERIAAGLRKFGGSHAEPFLVVLRNHQNASSLDKPVPTLTTSGANFGLCEPFVMTIDQRGRDGVARSMSEPISTLVTKNNQALVEPFVVSQNEGSDRRVHSIGDPLPTVMAGATRFGVVEPFLVEACHGGGDGRRARDLADPLGTVIGSNRFGLVEPFVLGQQSGSAPRSTNVPLPTVATDGAIALIEPFIVPQFSENGPRSVDRPLGTVTTTSRGVGLCEPYIVPLNQGEGDTRSHSINNPMPTVTSVDAWGVVEPFVTKFYGSGQGVSPVADPLPTTTTKERFGLVEVDGMRLDIRFRMLQPHELARAQGFPDDYKFAGNREQRVKQIGNAVPVNLAEALCGEMLGGVA